MPFFVPPAICADYLHPPAQMEVCNRLWIPRAIAQSLPSPQTPAVVEFYYSPTESVPAPSSEPLPSAIPQKAQDLGQPITVSPELNKPVPLPAAVGSSVPPSEKNKPVSTVLMGLNQRGLLPGDPRSRYLKVTTRGKSSQTFFVGQGDRTNLPLADSAPVPEATTPETLPEGTLEKTPEKTPKETANPVPAAGSGQTSPAAVPPPPENSVVELVADRQEYDSRRQIIYANGNVEMRFANAILIADRLKVSLNDRLAVAEGAVILKRGDQTLRGERFEYYFVQDSGIILNANGEIYQPSFAQDFSPGLPTAPSNNLVPNQTLSDRLAANQPLQRITTTEGFSFGVGTSLDVTNNDNQSINKGPTGGTINRVRFQAERVDFTSQGWTAENVRLTNDPFSPPELEIQAKKATLRSVAPLVDEIRLSDSRLVFDQQTSIPTFRDRLVLDRRDRQPGAIGLGYDGKDRGGLYIERGFRIVDNDFVQFEIKPQFLIQKALFPQAFPTEQSFNVLDTQDGVLSPGVFGAVTDLDVTFNPRTQFRAVGSFSSFDFNELENNVRARVAFQYKAGDLGRPYDYRLEYNYRERLFNGSLGFQTVNSSLGAIVVSPEIPLGNNFSLSYQGSIQNVEAPTDQTDLLPPNATDNVITLMRYQGATSLRHYVFLWTGQSLPPTPDEGLQYTSTPVFPYLQLVTGLTGVASYYSSGDNQPSLTGSIGLNGQFGHFSRPFFDYTGFGLTFSQALRGDASPFYFDRYVDTKTLSWGITQQIYGPVRLGAQGSINLDTSEEISTDFFVEYSRRTYNILLRYNPILEVGSINLRISDFNWSGNPGPFDGTGIRPVIDGVVR